MHFLLPAGWTGRVSCRGARVRVDRKPIRDPLCCVARNIQEAVGASVAWEAPDWSCEPIAVCVPAQISRVFPKLVSPRPRATVGPASGLFPLGLCREPNAGPSAVRIGPFPVYDRRLIFGIEVRILPCPGLTARPLIQAASVLSVRHLQAIYPVVVELNEVGRLLRGEGAGVIAHQEGSRRDTNHLRCVCRAKSGLRLVLPGFDRPGRGRRGRVRWIRRRRPKDRGGWFVGPAACQAAGERLDPYQDDCGKDDCASHDDLLLLRCELFGGGVGRRRPLRVGSPRGAQVLR